MKKKMQIKHYMAVIFLAFTAGQSALADQFCFSLADNYYEQVYCELEALGKHRDLPVWRDFRKNDETTQALLLKRPAKKAGIEIKMPTRKKIPLKVSTPIARAPQAQAKPSIPTSAVLSPMAKPPAVAAMPGCQKSVDRIICNNGVFTFAANRPNRALAKGALSAANTLGLPPFTATVEDSAAVQRYLTIAYSIYLEKMVGIGLAESTMGFDKFSYFFYDIMSKGINFSERFETMFKYLKKDKERIAVSVSKQPSSQLSIATCLPVSEAFITCSRGRQNYVFVRSEG